MFRRVRSLFRALFRRDAFESGVDAEFQFHLEQYTADLIRAGVPADVAARRARIEFGNPHSVRLECREARGAGPFDDVVRTMTSAWRSLRRAPGFSIAVVFTLALGIGANALVFSAVNGLLLKPLPIADADRLAWVFASTPQDPLPGKLDGDEAHALAAVASFSSVAVIGDRGFVKAHGPSHSRWSGLWVTTGLFDVLDVRPTIGRAFTAEDFGRSPAAILIGFERWQQDFAADPAVVGREIAFEDNHRFTVVGVLPRGLEFPLGRMPQTGNGTGFAIGRQDFWILGHDGAALPGGAVIGRLATGVSIDQAGAALAALSPVLANAGRDPRRSLEIVSLRDQALGPLAPALPFLQLFAALVFVIAAVNVAGLVLVRAARRAPEAAVRVALGARTSDLVKTLLAEGLWLSIASAGAAWFVVRFGRAQLIGLAGDASPILQRIDLDPAVFVFLAVSSLCVTTLIGVLPVAVVRRVAPGAILGRTSLRQRSGHRRGALRALVVCQVALSSLLLFGAATLGASLHRLLTVDAGYQSARVIAADVLLFFKGARPVMIDLVRRLQATSGVEAVGLVHSTPLTGRWVIRDSIGLLRGGAPEPTPPMIGSFVAFDYFKAMGIPILAGRDFTAQDYLAPNPPAIIVNDVVARTHFPDGALGARVHMYGATREIVGIVKGTRDQRLDAPAEPQFYQPIFFDGAQIVIRTTASPDAVVDAVRAELAAADPRAIVTRVAPLDSIVGESIVERRVTAWLVVAFAGLALALAIVGLYGVMQIAVSATEREIGVRAALGQPRDRIVGSVMASGLTMTVLGVAVALVLAVLLADAVRPLLFETPAFDPRIAIAVAALVMSVSALTCLRPAWRAATIDPVRVLRSE
ncbi:MAG TPA: ABC transporter permease [Vicinamibacterales bacterium]|nr:ABC transporter permease [Vicinamibacterales bacterium]